MSERSIFLPGSFFILIILIWGLNHFLLLAKVEEDSMQPSLQNGQIIWVNKQVRNIHKGDILVFLSPDDQQLLIKRCLLAPGDPLDLDNTWLETSRGPYYLTRRQYNRLKEYSSVPEDHYMMLGDNTFHSIDSRDFGFIPRDRIRGKVLGSHE